MQQSSTLGTSPDPCDLEAPWPIRARKDPLGHCGRAARQLYHPQAVLGSRADKLKGEDAARTARVASPWRRGQRPRFLPGAQCTQSPPSGSQSVKDQGHHGGREVQVGPHLVSTSHPRQCVSMMKECMMAKRGTLVDTWLVPVGPRCGGGDETPVVESEGKRSSMRQMVPAGWALQTVPAGLVQTAPSMLGPWNHPTSHLIKCTFTSAVSTLKAPFVQDTSY